MHNKVNQIYAFIADGEDSFCSVQMGNQHFPMVCVGEGARTLPTMKATARQIAASTGKTIRLVKFTQAEEIEAFAPPTEIKAFVPPSPH